MRKFDFVPNEGTDAVVTAYLHEILTEMQNHREKYPVMVVCPGGGYNICSQREADPIAFEYFAKGYNVFILNYSVREKSKDLVPLIELSKTMIAIRENAEQWNCDSEKIAVSGFSAGGHLAASLATLWNCDKLKKKMDTKNGLNKPNAAVLCYPVISSDRTFAHVGSLENASGGDQEMYEYLSLENRVSSETSPCFLWHYFTDTCVPVKNTLVFANALHENNVPFEMHIFPAGNHGNSICKNETNSNDKPNSQWVELSINYLNNLFDYEY